MLTRSEDSIEDDFRESIRRNNLLPDVFNVGIFKPFTDEKEEEDNKIRFLYPSWIFHDSVVEKVLEGKYPEIMPYTGEFVPTLNCSYRCRIPCSYMEQKKLLGVWNDNDFSNYQIHVRSVNFANELIDKLWQEGVKGIIFTGGGEPSLFTGLEDVMLHANEIGIDTVLYSNGNWIGEDRVDKVLQASPLLVRISLNAGTREIYNRFHDPINPESAYENVLRTIEKFAKGSLQNPSMSVGVSVVINAINGNDLIEAAARIQEIVGKTGGGIDFLAFRPAFNYKSPSLNPNNPQLGWQKTRQLQTDFLRQTYEVVEEKVRPILEDTGVVVSNVTSRFQALIDYQNDDYSRYYDECRASGLFVELAPDGKLHLCCDWNCHPDYVIGDLTTNTLHDVWVGEQRKKILHRINSCQCGVCPPACKPHDINKQFAQVEMFRASGELYKVVVWIQEQRKMAPPKMVNF